MLTRRDTVSLLAAAAAGPRLRASDAQWNAQHDQALLNAALQGMDAQFDAKEKLLSRSVSGAYNYHSTLRDTTAHPTRESLEYALLLLEAKQDERSVAILDRVIALQDTDPQSKWYGIWGYYMEEPPQKMSPADWNWADFNGATLLMIAYRHRGRLPSELKSRVWQSIRHAAASVRRRNVSMSYTNIAIQGTFVTLAAAQLLDDNDLHAYAVERLHRLAATIDVTGSFAEYNSPTYARVSIANLTRLRMTLKDSPALTTVNKIHHRAWLHLARHWHAPTRQLAGPHSRCYSTDIGAPVWLQKGLGGRLEFVPADKLTSIRNEGDVAVLDYHCPEDLHASFLEPPAPHLHREIFLAAAPPARPVAGATWLEPRFCLGSVNRGDFWVQRRPLLAYWTGYSRRPGSAQLRFLKDDYDFSSALFYSVQERGYVLGLVNFRTPGGDRHISLDPIDNGEFEASRLRLRLDLANLPEDFRVYANGKPVFGDIDPRAHLAFDLDGAFLHFQCRAGSFGDRTPRLSLRAEDSILAVSLDLIGGQQRIRWSDIQDAWLAITLSITAGKEERTQGFTHAEENAAVYLSWKTPAGQLALRGATRPAAVDEQDRAFEDFIDGTPVAPVRLSDERIG